MRLDRPPLPVWQWGVHAVYQALLHLGLPLIVAYFWRRGRREPLYRQHLTHRFGLGPVAPRGAVWIFAASLGEVRAASPLIVALRGKGHAVCLTVSTAAGLAEGRRLFGGDVVTRYVPLDLAWAIALFLARQRPGLGIVVEAEYWPGLLVVARRWRVPMVQVNGNLHERVLAQRGQGLTALRLSFLRLFTAITTKSGGYRDRYVAAGVDAGRIALVGELKFDLDMPAPLLARGRELKASWAIGCPVVLFASSIEAEEPSLAPVVAALAAMPQRPRILWVPRSPGRFDAVAALAPGALRRSTALGPGLEGPLPPDRRVLIGDSIGEMAAWYAMADLVFVGATLADRGGHSVTEPLSLGLPVVTGPSLWGVRYPADEAVAAGALLAVPDAAALQATIARLIAEPETLGALTARAGTFAASHRGAVDRTLAALAPLLA